MTAFKCIPVPTETAARFRDTGLDDNGNEIRRVIVADATGAPCRHCLQFGRTGVTMLLGSYNLPRPRGIYWTPSPIFLHAAECQLFSTSNVVAPIIGEGALVSVRAYDASDQCLYDLGRVCAGADVEEPLQRALADERAAFVNVHTARPGCLLSRIERLSVEKPLPQRGA